MFLAIGVHWWLRCCVRFTPSRPQQEVLEARIAELEEALARLYDKFNQVSSFSLLFFIPPWFLSFIIIFLLFYIYLFFSFICEHWLCFATVRHQSFVMFIFPRISCIFLLMKKVWEQQKAEESNENEDEFLAIYVMFPMRRDEKRVSNSASGATSSVHRSKK